MIQYASITASFSLLFQAFHIKHTISTAKYNKSHRLLFNTSKNITVTGDRGSFFNYDPIIRPPATDVCLYFVQSAATASSGNWATLVCGSPDCLVQNSGSVSGSSVTLVDQWRKLLAGIETSETDRIWFRTRGQLHRSYQSDTSEIAKGSLHCAFAASETVLCCFLHVLHLIILHRFQVSGLLHDFKSDIASSFKHWIHVY